MALELSRRHPNNKYTNYSHNNNNKYANYNNKYTNYNYNYNNSTMARTLAFLIAVKL